MQQNSRAASSIMPAHTPYRMAVSVKHSGRSTASWREQFEAVVDQEPLVWGVLEGWWREIEGSAVSN